MLQGGGIVLFAKSSKSSGSDPARFQNSGRKYGSISIAGISVCAVVASSLLVVSSGTQAASPSSLTTVVDLPANSKVDNLREKVKAASKAVAESKEAVAKSESKLPAAREKIAIAKAQEAGALEKEKIAQQAHAVAVAKVAAQQQRIQAVKEQIRQIELRIGAIARYNYISGAENQELNILLESQNPGEFATGLESVRRVSRVNANLFDEAEQLRQELNKQLQVLEGLENAAKQKQVEATQHAQEAAAKRVEAERAKQEVDAIIADQKAELAKGRKLLDGLREKYDELLASIGGERGYARGSTGVNRSPREAVAWAMQYVGNGAYYNHLCLKFVDDAYAATGSRSGRAIDQWYKAKAAGKAHPGDRNPPIGAQVFWWSGNDAKHVALYAGGGMIISTGADYDRVGMVPWSYFDGYGPYLGWAEAYYP